MPNFNREKCHQRSRLAAKRDGVEAAPVLFLRSNPGSDTPAPLTTARGVLPGNDADALALINAGRPGQSPLTEDDVYVHYLEAANSNFVGDRFLFLDPSTLRNIAADAQTGFAFMNSHRTGGLSAPAELPFGRTFAGRYEMATGEGGEVSHRAVVGFYMLRGIQPNGAGGPSTDDLHRSIDAGTIFDCSVGLHGGDHLCDICGEDLDALKPGTDGWDDSDYLCQHVPGTTQNMSKAEIAAQKARGVPNGEASYSLVGAHCGEVSAVYDGAVPGAGFRKSLSFARHQNLSLDSLKEARAAYAHLFSPSELSQIDTLINGLLDNGGTSQTPPAASGRKEKSMKDKLAAAFAKLGLHKLAGQALDAPEDDTNALAERLASNLKTEVDAQVAEREGANPMLTALAAAEVKTPEALAAVLSDAKAGREATTALRAKACENAIIAYGAEDGKLEAETLASLSGPQLTRYAARIEKDALAKVGTGQAQTLGTETAGVTFAQGANDADPKTPKPVHLVVANHITSTYGQHLKK